MKTNDGQRGISIIELLMGMLSASILAVTVGLMLVTSYRGWKDNNRHIALQEEMSLTHTVAERWVREAAYWETSATNSIISITTTNVTKRLYRSANNLIFDPDISNAGNELLVATNHVFNFLTRRAPSGVYMDLWLSDGTINVELHTFMSFRN